MRSVWYLLALRGAVNALPNKLNFRELHPRAGDFCNVTVGGNTVVGECVETLVNSDGHTVISGTTGAVTLPTGVTTPIITTLDGTETTITPSDLIVQTTDLIGETAFSHGTTAITISTGITTPIETVLPNGESTTITPVVVAQTGESVATNSKGSTVISDTDGTVILPTGVTTPITTTFPDGKKTTITPDTLTIVTNPPSSSTTAGAIIIPVTTSVDGPKHTDGGVVVPCNYFWFFDICPKWDDISIFGWFFKTPDGVHPPGPPPGINPGPGISISIPTPLPDWPQWTLPPDGTPQTSPKPDDCQPQTGEACFYHTQVSPVTTNQATTTTTIVSSTCATVTGCEATNEASSTVTTASGTPTVLTYAVYPSDGTNADQVNAIAAQLPNFVNDSSQIYASNTKDFGLNFWRLPLDESSVKDVENIANVAQVSAECGLFCPKGASCAYACYDPSTLNVYQSDAEMQLRYVSWAPNQATSSTSYMFDDSAGLDIPVYIVDTGAVLSNPEFDLIREKTEWIRVPFPNGTLPASDDEQNNRLQYHVVRLPTGWSQRADGQWDYRGFTPSQWLEALSRVLQSLGPMCDQPRATADSVVLLADFYPRGGDGTGQAWVTRCFAIIDEMSKRGAVVVTGTPNEKKADNPNGEIDGWPANFGKTEDDSLAFSIPALIVAGAISPLADIAPYIGPTEGIPNIYAPGVSMIVAAGDTQAGDTRSSAGNSCAAAMTAGLAAYFIKLTGLGRINIPDQSPLGIKHFIQQTAWSRYNTDLHGIFNAIDPQQNFCPWNPNPATQRLRRTDDSAQCALPNVPFVPIDKMSYVCHDEADFPGHADIQAAEQEIHDQVASALWAGDVNGKDDTILHPGDARLAHTYFSYGVNYTYSVEWVDGCTTTAANQSVYSPAGPKDYRKCYSLLGWCYTTCINGGVGGSYQVGCLKYTFTGGVGKPK